MLNNQLTTSCRLGKRLNATVKSLQCQTGLDQRQQTSHQNTQQETLTMQTTGASYVPWVLEQLTAMFGHLFAKDNQFRQADGSLQVCDRSGLWAAELERVNADWLGFGLNRYRDRIRAESNGGEKCWPPTAVQFAAACLPTATDLGFADAAGAWLTACSHSHQPKAIKCPAIQAAASGMWFEIRSASSRYAIAELEKRFKKSYQAAINRVLAGESIEPRELITHEAPKPAPAINTVQRTPEQQAAYEKIRANIRKRFVDREPA